MKKQFINEAKQMQKLAGILKENAMQADQIGPVVMNLAKRFAAESAETDNYALDLKDLYAQFAVYVMEEGGLSLEDVSKAAGEYGNKY
jgi:hypothetical protein